MFFDSLDNQRAEIMQKFDFDSALACMNDRRWTYRGQAVNKQDLISTANELLMNTIRMIDDGLTAQLEDNVPFESSWVSTSTGRFTAFGFKMYNGQWRLELMWGLEKAASTQWD